MPKRPIVSSRYDRVMDANEILVAIRRVMRAIDLRSKQLERQAGLTVPQLIVLQALNQAENLQISELARHVSLSHATVTSMLKRLDAKGLVNREPNSTDRRAISVSLTTEGKSALESAPQLLQAVFIARFQELAPWEQKLLTSALERIASMMEADEIEASPILEVGEILTEPPSSGVGLP